LKFLFHRISVYLRYKLLIIINYHKRDLCICIEEEEKKEKKPQLIFIIIITLKTNKKEREREREKNQRINKYMLLQKQFFINY